MSTTMAVSSAVRAIIVGIIAVTGFAAVASAQSAQRAMPAPLPNLGGVDLSSAPSRGEADSPVTLVMFTDFGNPACANAGVILQGLVDLFPKGLRVVFKHTLPPNRPDRALAHQAVRAAGEQGKFWEMHDLLLANHERQQMADVLEMARLLELDVTRFSAALESDAARAIVEQDRQVAERLQIREQPTWFLNGERIPGPITLADLRRRIEALLAGGA